MISPSASALQLITSELAWHYFIVPERFENGLLELLVSDKSDMAQVREELNVQIEQDLVLKVAEHERLIELLNQHYKRSRSSSKILETSGKGAENFLEAVISEAENVGSSDIHMEVYASFARIRFRIDGHLVERYRLKVMDFPALINRIKIKANLDISEKRLPQDGRIEFSGPGTSFDIRVSTLPTLYGEKVVLRLLSRDSTNIDIRELGMDSNELAKFMEGVAKPHGLLLISGPTGSGKTTTLYATLKNLNEEKRNVLTIEHPIEYTLDGINQVQLKEDVGLSYASALKSFLRQDPDVIMIGEIRDKETAEMSVRAALTGHLVLSTIHTNSAWGIIARLIDMGLPPFVIAETVNTVVAQRLVRTLCLRCRKGIVLSDLPEKIRKITTSQDDLFTATGCNDCYNTGYAGRKAIFEIVNVDPELTEMIKKGVPVNNEVLKLKGAKFLGESAIELFRNGATSMEEIYPLLISSER